MSYRLRRMYKDSNYAAQYNGIGFKKLKTFYTVSRTLKLCHSSSAATAAEAHMPYTETISPEEYSTLSGATISVTMGGVDITATAFSEGVISIASVTGDVVINVTAVASRLLLYTPNISYSAYGVLFSKQTNKYCVIWAETGKYFRLKYEQVISTRRVTMYAFPDTSYSSSTITIRPFYVSDWYDSEQAAYDAIQNENTEYTFHNNNYMHTYITSYYVGSTAGQQNCSTFPFVKSSNGGSYFPNFSGSMESNYSISYSGRSKFDANELILQQGG